MDIRYTFSRNYPFKGDCIEKCLEKPRFYLQLESKSSGSLWGRKTVVVGTYNKTGLGGWDRSELREAFRVV